MSWLRRRSRRLWQWLRMRRKIQCHNKFEPADTHKSTHRFCKRTLPLPSSLRRHTPRDTELFLSSPCVNGVHTAALRHRPPSS